MFKNVGKWTDLFRLNSVLNILKYISSTIFQDIIILCNHISIKLPVRTQYAFSNQFVTIVISRGYAKFDLLLLSVCNLRRSLILVQLTNNNGIIVIKSYDFYYSWYMDLKTFHTSHRISYNNILISAVLFCVFISTSRFVTYEGLVYLDTFLECSNI